MLAEYALPVPLLWRRSCCATRARNGGVTMKSVALFLLRVVMGGLLVGHGAQKLFGAFGGKGVEGTGQSFKKIGLEPARHWAEVAGVTEIAVALGYDIPRPAKELRQEEAATEPRTTEELSAAR